MSQASDWFVWQVVWPGRFSAFLGSSPTRLKQAVIGPATDWRSGEKLISKSEVDKRRNKALSQSTASLLLPDWTEKDDKRLAEKSHCDKR